MSSLTFRQGTPQLFSASFDRAIKLWNAEDRCHIDTLHGHECEVVTIDCLRKERLLTVARDRTARLWKVGNGMLSITLLNCGLMCAFCFRAVFEANHLQSFAFPIIPTC